MKGFRWRTSLLVLALVLSVPLSVSHAGKNIYLYDPSVATDIDVNAYLALLGRDRTLVQVGMPAQPIAISAMSLAYGRKRVASSMIGGLKETQQMLDFCAEHRIVSDIEQIAIQQVNEAYERELRNDVKYRFVIDLASLRS